jgi:hypothetical protein
LQFAARCSSELRAATSTGGTEAVSAHYAIFVRDLNLGFVTGSIASFTFIKAAV